MKVARNSISRAEFVTLAARVETVANRCHELATRITVDNGELEKHEAVCSERYNNIANGLGETRDGLLRTNTAIENIKTMMFWLVVTTAASALTAVASLLMRYAFR